MAIPFNWLFMIYIVCLWSRMLKTNRPRQLFKTPKAQPLKPIDPLAQDTPEDSATSYLLRISNEDFNLDPVPNHQPQKMSISRQNSAQFLQPPGSCSQGIEKTRLSVAEHYTECFRMCRKISHNDSPDPQLPLRLQKNAVSPSNFLIFSGENYDNLKPTSQQSYKPKQSKNMSSMILKKNKSLMKQYLDLQKEVKHVVSSLSPTRRLSPTPVLYKMSKSTGDYSHPHRHLSLEKPPSPIKIISTMKIDERHLIEFQCTSPTFRNRKLNYRQLRYASSGKAEIAGRKGV